MDASKRTFRLKFWQGFRFSGAEVVFSPRSEETVKCSLQESVTLRKGQKLTVDSGLSGNINNSRICLESGVQMSKGPKMKLKRRADRVWLQ